MSKQSKLDRVLNWLGKADPVIDRAFFFLILACAAAIPFACVGLAVSSVGG